MKDGECEKVKDCENKEHEFWNGKFCEKCSENCAECEERDDKCTSCKEKWVLKEDDTCEELECEEGEFLDGDIRLRSSFKCM